MKPLSVAVWTQVIVLAAAVAADAQQPPRISERVEVSRVVIDARVVDAAGDAVRGLTTEDFEVKIDGKPARVESSTWIARPGDGPAGSATPGASADADEGRDAARNRLIVILVQKSLEPARVVGLMRMLVATRSFLDTFSPEDRVAVLSFDSHLKIWLDFTSDLSRVRAVLQRGILFERPGPVQEATSPSLVARLDPARARRVYTIERALRLLGEALEPLPGGKAVVIVGHGFGRFGPFGVAMEPEYASARAALQAARASVFCLDVTQADYHSLELGLQTVAEDTGGFFARTYLLPDQAISRLAGALAGHYVLFVDAPEVEPGVHRIHVKLTRRKGTVLAKTTYAQ